jgi:hypothetical protein
MVRYIMRDSIIRWMGHWRTPIILILLDVGRVLFQVIDFALGETNLSPDPNLNVNSIAFRERTCVRESRFRLCTVKAVVGYISRKASGPNSRGVFRA